MTLQSTGPISLSNIATEFGGSAPHAISEYYRGGAYVGSGAPNVPTSGEISLSQFYGAKKAFVFNATISSSTLNYNLKNAAIAAGWNQTDPLIATVTINSGVYVGSSSTGTYAFSTGSSFPAGSTLTLTNNGYIVGCSGAGGTGKGNLYNSTVVAGSAGGGGGHALLAQAYITIYNYGYIAGGGGGGGGAGHAISTAPNGKSVDNMSGGGGGGGGGAGWYSGGGGSGGNVAFGYIAHGVAGSSGGTASAGGGGAGGYTYFNGYWARGGTGGSGGGWGSAGATGATGTSSGSNGATNYAGNAGGAAGYSVVGNAYITWGAAGTRLGTIG